MIDLPKILAHLKSERLAVAATALVDKLEMSIAAGVVRNVDLTEAKFTLNRAVERALESFDEANKTPYATRSVLVMGAYNLPAALKESLKHKNEARAEFIRSLLPINDLLQAAKPLVVKRGEGPKVPSAKEAAKLAKAMTCQCCARQIFAETGLIAHHGYERPGDGWQTASCSGARHLPFEVDRAILGLMIVSLKDRLKGLRASRAAVKAETASIARTYTDYSKPIDSLGYRPKVEIEFTRSTFAAVVSHDIFKRHHSAPRSFDALKADEIVSRDRGIASLVGFIADQQARFDGWKQTHEWAAGKWHAI